MYHTLFLFLCSHPSYSRRRLQTSSEGTLSSNRLLFLLHPTLPLVNGKPSDLLASFTKLYLSPCELRNSGDPSSSYLFLDLVSFYKLYIKVHNGVCHLYHGCGARRGLITHVTTRYVVSDAIPPPPTIPFAIPPPPLPIPFLTPPPSKAKI